jgi:hypothetical protein
MHSDFAPNQVPPEVPPSRLALCKCCARPGLSSAAWVSPRWLTAGTEHPCDKCNFRHHRDHLHDDLGEVVVLSAPGRSPHPALVQDAAQRVHVHLQTCGSQNTCRPYSKADFKDVSERFLGPQSGLALSLRACLGRPRPAGDCQPRRLTHVSFGLARSVSAAWVGGQLQAHVGERFRSWWLVVASLLVAPTATVSRACSTT